MNQFGKFAEKIGILVQGGTVNVGQIRLDSEMSRQELRNRKALLNNVRNAWVEGVLEKSLHEQIPIVLGLENRPSAVASPWNLDIINPDKSCQPLPTGTPVIDVFDNLGEGGTLLILGEPGSGKTITLLQLARDLIARAEEEIDRRIPVVLNLSSWAAEKQTIAKWIVEELNSKYQVNRKIGQQWVEKQELLLLLDGLDEIRDLEKRNACVTALNVFQMEQATEMVVCCRIKDYEELGNQLKLRSAIVVQPLATNQIQTYLNQLQSDVTALKIMLTQDETLQELAQSPLLLSIMVLAYQGIEDISDSAIASDRKRHLFEDYINRIFQGSRPKSYLKNICIPEKQYYSRQNATRWLIWMAKQMIQHSQTIFLIEKMQFSWLKGDIKRLYITLCMNTVFLIERIQLNWIKENSKHLNDIAQLIASFILLIISILSLSIGYYFFYQIVHQLISPITALIPIIGDNPFFVFISYVLTLGIILSIFIDEIQPIYSVKSYMKWNNAKFKRIQSFVLKYTPFVWIIFSVIFLIYGVLGMWDKSFPRDLIHILLQIVIMGLLSYFSFFALGISFFVITDGFEFGLLPVQVDTSVYPNQGIRKSAINAMLIGVILGIVGSIIYIYVKALNIAINGELINVGLIVVFLSSMQPFGGKASVQHLVLRFILCSKRNIPWNYAKFLDWASDKLFLQKVGGGYIFIHRSLMEHFAEMENG